MNKLKNILAGLTVFALALFYFGTTSLAQDATTRSKELTSPEDFLRVAGTIPPGSTREFVEERLGKPLDATPSLSNSTRECWIYYRDDRATCSVEYGMESPAGYRGAAINIVARAEPEAGIDALTQENVAAFLTSVDTATQKMDVPAVLKCMADDVVIRIEMPGKPQSRVLQMNREQYEKYLKESYEGVTDYQYDRQPSEITISADSKRARSTHKIVEKASRGQTTQTSESMESASIELRQGRLVITYIDAAVLAVR